MASIFRSEIIVSPEDQHIVDEHTWHLKCGYYRSGEGKYLHTYIFPNFLRIDHIDGNKKNNLRSNLRDASHQQNLCNRPKQINNTTGYKGVYKVHNRNLYMARIGVQGKDIYLGCFTHKELAAWAYNRAAIEYHDIFACLNPL